MVKAALSNTSPQFDTPTVVCTLMNLIGFKIFNFNKFANNLDVKAFFNDKSTLSHNCRGSSFVDKVYNHIATGNLKTFNSNKLCKFFSEGPQHRENRTADCQKATESIITVIKSYIQSWFNNTITF